MPFMLNVIIQSESRSAVLAFLAGALVLWFMKAVAYRRLFYVGDRSRGCCRRVTRARGLLGAHFHNRDLRLRRLRRRTRAHARA